MAPNLIRGFGRACFFPPCPFQSRRGEIDTMLGMGAGQGCGRGGISGAPTAGKLAVITFITNAA